MAQDALSQSEIDALLTQTQNVEEDSGEEQSAPVKEKAVFSFNFRKQKKIQQKPVCPAGKHSQEVFAEL